MSDYRGIIYDDSTSFLFGRGSMEPAYGQYEHLHTLPPRAVAQQG